MRSIFIFEQVDENTLTVHARSCCGTVFRDCVHIVDIHSVNPGIRIMNPSATIGMNLLSEIILWFRTEFETTTLQEEDNGQATVDGGNTDPNGSIDGV